MAGIEQHWQTEVNRAALLEVPQLEPGVAARALSWCFSTALGALCWTVGLFLPRGDQAAAEKKEQSGSAMETNRWCATAQHTAKPISGDGCAIECALGYPCHSTLSRI